MGAPEEVSNNDSADESALQPNTENSDADGLGAFAVALAEQQAAARAAAGEEETEEEQDRAAAFMQRALAESARMTTAYRKDLRKIERTRAQLPGNQLEEAIAEHAAEVLSGPPPAGVPLEGTTVAD